MIEKSQLQASLLGFWETEVFAHAKARKEPLLLEHFTLLTEFHRQQCPAFERICSAMGFSKQPQDLSELPYLAVRLFKSFELHSLGDASPFKILQSSGTTGQAPARILLDRETSMAQSKALVKTLQADIGKSRLPMLIIDSPDVVKNKSLFSARSAGIQGLSLFGRDHTYALNSDMSLNTDGVEAFLSRHQGRELLLFGFTFMVWLHWIRALEQRGKKLDIRRGTLLHSGGWKKLIEKQVDNATFKGRLRGVSGIQHVVNFYGMAEQVGSVFTECSEGLLHCSVFNDVIIRDPYDLSPMEVGQTGLIQVLSVLPMSFPGHSLLTEDKGRLRGIDDCPCGRRGKYFRVLGRLPKVEVRGCSDTYGEPS